ncbi:uncharacterized protein KY384_008774 [Bacidia gigantensis]|uniref:uncharacterized protein n=1 Tax=Bacidia gigantensis TaxID=2732470 RepID=UPI001D042493|nr:uncharacterized protein KY384_008774 [Bacidia gigantensis]KAG8526573.1 hypothetical protein KY384_008774 [Bacidia gigantensis]
MPFTVHIPNIWQAILLVTFAILPTRLYAVAVKHFFNSKLAPENAGSTSALEVVQLDEKDSSNLAVPQSDQQHEEAQEISRYKLLYHKLHNLEQYPDILPQARDLLLSLLTETLNDAKCQTNYGILSIDQYTPDALAHFMQAEHDRITQAWEQYILRRRQGLPREMFQNKEEAAWWLKQMAPVKYVDGAWLGHVNKVTTPFSLRPTTKDAWQVMSEELGDGNSHMNHVYVYKDLMRDIRSGLPDADDARFIHPDHQLDQVGVWKAAVAQLLVSLFPNEFLPEILGYNMHFEGLTMETMKAARELEELGLNSYYFALHISIDNADSGHTAIALQSVTKYLDIIKRNEGEVAVQQAWKRVQAGFILSAGAEGPQCPSQRSSIAKLPVYRTHNTQEKDVLRIFKAKTPVAYKIHCTSRIKMGGRRFVDWLEPHAFKDPQWQADFLHHLAHLKPWVRKGNSKNSRLVKELSWGGKMFGSFTHSEVDAVARWIDSMGNASSQDGYWAFTGREKTDSAQAIRDHNFATDNPVLSPTVIALPFPPLTMATVDSTGPPPYSAASRVLSDSLTMPVLIPLWLTSPCLLESTISIPSKTTTILASSVVRLLRAQNGFEAEIDGPGVPGMDEARRTDNTGLIEIGLEMLLKTGGDGKQPRCLKDVLEPMPSDFALTMLKLSGKPTANLGLLLGMSWAFVGLHEAVATRTAGTLLSDTTRDTLIGIISREKSCLMVCFDEIKGNKELYADFHRGFSVALGEIRRCFGGAEDMEEDWVADVSCEKATF